MRLRTFWLNLGWLVVLVLTVTVVLGLDAAGRLTYFASLLFWGIPIAYLWPTLPRHVLTSRAQSGGTALGPPA